MRVRNRVLFLFLFFGIGFSSNAQTEYDAHLEAAKTSGIIPIKNLTSLNSYVYKKKLVHISQGRGYTIAKLTHSRPYLTPRSYKVLKQIGNSFYAKGKHKTFTVSSVTRTLADQQRLSRVNSNAVTTKFSSHNYGCSFDLSYISFNKRRAANAQLEKVLENILVQLEKEGKIYYIKEYREKCFHVTVR